MKNILIALSLIATAAPAATIQWGGSVWGTDLQSDGVTPLTSAFDFEIGTWAEGFVPSDSNYVDWSANWEPIATTSYNATNMFFAGETQFLDENTSLPDIQFNGNTYIAGDQVYLWGYNTKTVAPGSEWTLVTNGVDWTVPSASPSQSSLPVSFRVSNADSPMIGDLPTTENGGGEYTPPVVAFEIQTAAVPEPGAGILAVFGLALIFRRRR